MINAHYTKRFGRKVVVPSLQGESRFYENSLAGIGPRLFNVLPQYIRDMTLCTVDIFKANLDKFLRIVSGEPVLSGYTGGNNQQYGSNSLVNIV